MKECERKRKDQRRERSPEREGARAITSALRLDDLFWPPSAGFRLMAGSVQMATSLLSHLDTWFPFFFFLSFGTVTTFKITVVKPGSRRKSFRVEGAERRASDVMLNATAQNSNNKEFSAQYDASGYLNQRDVITAHSCYSSFSAFHSTSDGQLVCNCMFCHTQKFIQKCLLIEVAMFNVTRHFNTRIQRHTERL